VGVSRGPRIACQSGAVHPSPTPPLRGGASFIGPAQFAIDTIPKKRGRIAPPPIAPATRQGLSRDVSAAAGRGGNAATGWKLAIDVRLAKGTRGAEAGEICAILRNPLWRRAVSLLPILTYVFALIRPR